MGLFDWIKRKRKNRYIMEWSRKYHTGITEIDVQHEKLFSMYNDLVHALFRGESMERLGSILDRLLKYVVVHFTAEEKYMERYGYPELEEHRAIHRSLMEKTYQLHKDFEAGRPVLTEDLLVFLKEWITEHILKTDLKYKDFLGRRVQRI